jgi:hypothetical protein
MTTTIGDPAMADYVFTGAYPRLLFGLIQGVNAWHSPASGDPSELTHGQTVIAEPGDSVRTTNEYLNAELSAVEEAEPAPVTAKTKPTTSSKGAQK